MRVGERVPPRRPRLAVHGRRKRPRLPQTLLTTPYQSAREMSCAAKRCARYSAPSSRLCQHVCMCVSWLLLCVAWPNNRIKHALHAAGSCVNELNPQISNRSQELARRRLEFPQDVVRAYRWVQGQAPHGHSAVRRQRWRLTPAADPCMPSAYVQSVRRSPRRRWQRIRISARVGPGSSR